MELPPLFGSNIARLRKPFRVSNSVNDVNANKKSVLQLNRNFQMLAGDHMSQLK